MIIHKSWQFSTTLAMSYRSAGSNSIAMRRTTIWTPGVIRDEGFSGMLGGISDGGHLPWISTVVLGVSGQLLDAACTEDSC